MYRYLPSPFQCGFIALAILLTLVAFERLIGRNEPSARVVREQQSLIALELEQKAADAARRSEAVILLRQADQANKDALASSGTWQEQIEPLLENDAGRVIAAHPELVKELANVLYEERPAAGELTDMSRRIERLTGLLDDADSTSSPTTWPTAQLAEIKQLHSAAIAAGSDWQTAVKQAQAIFRTAKRTPAEDVTPDQSLRELVQEAYDDQTIADMPRLRAEKEEREAKRAAEAARAAEVKAAAEAAATSPEVQRVLAPMLAVRNGQPKLSGAAVRIEKTSTSQAMSLSRIESMGALEPTDNGLKMLARIGTDRDLTPPRWTFPSEPNNWSAETRAFLNQAQQLLREHGTALVRANKLSP